MARPRNNLINQQFHNLKVISFSHVNKNGDTHWHCSCDCGNHTIVCGTNLKNSGTKSCGCLRNGIYNQTHGMSGTLIYRIWSGMLNRCNNPNNQYYYRYGGRGIKVCTRWHKFENFLADMGKRPKNKTLDRVNNDGDYTYENCRWATKIEQANNTSLNVWLTVNNETHTLVQWSKIKRININTLEARLRRGWSPEKTINTAVETKYSRNLVH